MHSVRKQLNFNKSKPCNEASSMKTFWKSTFDVNLSGLVATWHNTERRLSAHKSSYMSYSWRSLYLTLSNSESASTEVWLKSTLGSNQLKFHKRAFKYQESSTYSKKNTNRRNVFTYASKLTVAPNVLHVC